MSQKVLQFSAISVTLFGVSQIVAGTAKPFTKSGELLDISV
jgi:hypothetical protein